MGIRCLTDERSLEDLDFASDNLCLMSHKLENLQTNTNKLAKEEGRGSEDGERREDRSDKVTQPLPPPTTTRSLNHHQPESKRSCLSDLPSYLDSIVSTIDGGTDDVKRSENIKTGLPALI
ncbi:unnamed protein product [Heterobilharzia americana]|nr:unnamed protein product [Heterobilharzia americana]